MRVTESSKEVGYARRGPLGRERGMQVEIRLLGFTSLTSLSQSIRFQAEA